MGVAIRNISKISTVMIVPRPDDLLLCIVSSSKGQFSYLQVAFVKYVTENRKKFTLFYALDNIFIYNNLHVNENII